MNDKNRYLTETEILSITEKSMHKTFGELGLSSFRDKSNKGGLGTFIEESVFEYKANNDDSPDFITAGIELKVTPVKRNEDGSFSSKERLVLNMIDYGQEELATFETSSFYRKNRRLLIWFYHYIKDIPETSYLLTAYDLFEFENSLEYKIIKKDWEIIHQKIKKGLAHTISESDTTFLAACTKGTNSNSTRKQPHSDVEAKCRAYSLKSSFMTRLYRELIHQIAPYVSFVSDEEWMKNPLEEIFKEKLTKYYGKSVAELANRFNIKNNPKDLCFKISQRTLGLTGKDSGTIEMIDAGIKLKTVRVHKNGTPCESMSFPALDFIELINQKWENSDIREDFVDWKLMLFVFKEDNNNVMRFDRVQFWNIPNNIVDGEIKIMYEQCAMLVKNGDALYYDDGKIKDMFPKEKRNSNGVCHVRPHGRVAADTFKLPISDKKTGKTEYTKQCFWLNKLFVKKILEDKV